jgi:uncharacterized protein (DUF924 family)
VEALVRPFAVRPHLPLACRTNGWWRRFGRFPHRPVLVIRERALGTGRSDHLPILYDG